MKISTDDLIRFNMDRFGVEVIVTKTDSGLAYKVSTFPVDDHHTREGVENEIDQLIESGAMKARAFMMLDGSFAMEGFKPTARGRIINFVADGRRFYHGRLDMMEDERNLKQVALDTIKAMIVDGLDLEDASFEFACGDHFALKSVLLGTHFKGDDHKMSIMLPGVVCGIENGDFATWWQGKVRARYDALILEMIDSKLAENKESAHKVLATIDRLERVYDLKREARTNPAGIPRPRAGSNTLN